MEQPLTACGANRCFVHLAFLAINVLGILLMSLKGRGSK